MLCALNPEELVPAEHALRGIKALTDRALGDMDDELEAMYASHGRPSVPPERLLKSMLLMALYSIRSDRQFCEQLRYNLLYRWFLDMEMTDAVWDRTTFSHNRERLLEHDVARVLFGMVVEQAREQKLTSSEHFSVDGTLIEAWASMKSFRPKDSDDDGPDNNGWSDFRGTKRRNETHESKTDPVRKRIEEIFGSMKTIGGLRRTRFKGRRRTELHALLVGTAYNLLRIAKLQPALAN